MNTIQSHLESHKTNRGVLYKARTFDTSGQSDVRDNLRGAYQLSASIITTNALWFGVVFLLVLSSARQLCLKKCKYIHITANCTQKGINAQDNVKRLVEDIAFHETWQKGRGKAVIGINTFKKQLITITHYLSRIVMTYKYLLII